jgi:histidinol-phosphate aminotransferase
MSKIWKKRLDAVKPYVPGKPVKEVKRALGLEEVIKLASNENPLPPSLLVLKAIETASKNMNEYPDGYCYYLRESLAAKLGVSGNNLIFGNGSDEVLILAIRAFAGQGDEVVMAKPTFMVYSIASMVEGVDIKQVPLKNLKYDLDAMAKAVTDRTKIIFIANPDNPTGSYVTREELDAFLNKLPDTVCIVLDEAYYEFATGEDYPETLPLINDPEKNIIITRTFSKAYGLAGLRVGYGIAREDIAEVLNKVREPFNVNSLAQAAALAALEDVEYLNKSVALVDEERRRFFGFLEDMGIEYVKSRANFILINTKKDSRSIFDQLMKQGIIVREMSGWGLPGYIRVNIGLPEQDDRFFTAFKEIIKG